MDSHKLRIHWKAKDGRDKSEPGMVETPPPALWWLMLIPLAANWHLWGNPPTSTPPSIIVLTPGLSPFPSLKYTHTHAVCTHLRNGLTSFRLGRGATLKVSLSPWQIVKKRVVSENCALLWLALWGTGWTFDKAFNGQDWGLSRLGTSALDCSSPANFQLIGRASSRKNYFILLLVWIRANLLWPSNKPWGTPLVTSAVGIPNATWQVLCCFFFPYLQA